MIRTALRIAIVSAALSGLAVSSASGQTRYRLDGSSTIEAEFCLGPCDCAPSVRTGPARGVFTLTFDHMDPLFTYYAVSDVQIIASPVDGVAVMRLVGSGTYQIGGEVAVTHRLQLALHWEENDMDFLFDSGFGVVDPAHPFPEISSRVESDLVICTQLDLNLLATPVRCPGDLTGDGEVGIQDLAILLHNFGLVEGATPDDGDMDEDGDVDLPDLAYLLAQFGAQCP
ncbi:MAG: hypothetical protein HZB38_05480 [Planctomycetes bacterium]|nr:hypothetical protein [Planctomycetota bacterium]